MSDTESESENVGDMIQNTRLLRSTSNAKKCSEAKNNGESVMSKDDSLIQLLLAKMDQNTLKMDQNHLQIKNDVKDVNANMNAISTNMDKNLQEVNLNMSAISANVKQTNFVMAQNKETLNAKIDDNARKMQTQIANTHSELRDICDHVKSNARRLDEIERDQSITQ